MKYIRNLLLTLIGVMALTAYAYDNSNSTSTNGCDPCSDRCGSSCEPCDSCEDTCEPCCETPKGPCTSAYNHPGRVNVCGSWDFYVRGTYLYWQPRMEQLEYAYLVYAANSTNIGSIYRPGFSGKSAFKVAIGYKFECDDWNWQLQYTRLNCSTGNSVKTDSTATLNSLWLTQALTGYTNEEISGQWDLDFNIFDLDLARMYYNGQYLKFNAFYGLKGGWIDNSFYTKDTNLDNPADTVDGTYSSDSWLIGPRIGVNTHWMLCEGFRIFGDAAVSLFYQKFHDIKLREPQKYNTSAYYAAYNDSYRQISANAEMQIGLGWGTYFARNNWYFDLSVGYELQLYLNQNMPRYIETIIRDGTHTTKLGNLFMHGLNVTMELDF